MKKVKLDNEDLQLDMAIPGFSARLEEQMKLRSPSKNQISRENVTSMPTFAFVSLALQNNSPLKVIKTIDPSKNELEINSRARSAKLRIIERIGR